MGDAQKVCNEKQGWDPSSREHQSAIQQLSAGVRDCGLPGMVEELQEQLHLCLRLLLLHGFLLLPQAGQQAIDFRQAELAIQMLQVLLNLLGQRLLLAPLRRSCSSRHLHVQQPQAQA